tara:strand:+ start:51 stop:191 length:141 start_codon:yes stop_codon:yes gene_type:complete
MSQDSTNKIIKQLQDHIKKLTDYNSKLEKELGIKRNLWVEDDRKSN